MRSGRRPAPPLRRVRSNDGGKITFQNNRRTPVMTISLKLLNIHPLTITRFPPRRWAPKRKCLFLFFRVPACRTSCALSSSDSRRSADNDVRFVKSYICFRVFPGEPPADFLYNNIVYTGNRVSIYCESFYNSSSSSYHYPARVHLNSRSSAGTSRIVYANGSERS